MPDDQVPQVSAGFAPFAVVQPGQVPAAPRLTAITMAGTPPVWYGSTALLQAARRAYLQWQTQRGVQFARWSPAADEPPPWARCALLSDAAAFEGFLCAFHGILSQQGARNLPQASAEPLAVVAAIALLAVDERNPLGTSNLSWPPPQLARSTAAMCRVIARDLGMSFPQPLALTRIPELVAIWMLRHDIRAAPGAACHHSSGRSGDPWVEAQSRVLEDYIAGTVHVAWTALQQCEKRLPADQPRMPWAGEMLDRLICGTCDCAMESIHRARWREQQGLGRGHIDTAARAKTCVKHHRLASFVPAEQTLWQFLQTAVRGAGGPVNRHLQAIERGMIRHPLWRAYPELHLLAVARWKCGCDKGTAASNCPACGWARRANAAARAEDLWVLLDASRFSLGVFRRCRRCGYYYSADPGEPDLDGCPSGCGQTLSQRPAHLAVLRTVAPVSRAESYRPSPEDDPDEE